MDNKKIEAELNYLEIRVQALEKSWKAEKFQAELEITKRWRKKESLRQKRLTIKFATVPGDAIGSSPKYRLSGMIRDAEKWSSLIHKGLLYRQGELWYVRKTLAEDAGYLVLEV